MRIGLSIARVGNRVQNNELCQDGKLLMRAFAQAERFVSEIESRKLRPAYVFVGDEAFFRKRFRDAILEHLVPSDLRDFSLFEFDLQKTTSPKCSTAPARLH